MTSLIVLFLSAVLAGQAGRPANPAPPNIAGVYKPIPDGTTLPGGLRNAGSPAEISVLPAAAEQAKKTDLNTDPWRHCKPLGPFRMMARPDTKVEFVPQAGMLYMIFEDLSHGVMRQIYMGRGHKEKLETRLWFGDSIGTWQGDTLVIDSIGFNGRSWFNDAGVMQSDALHLVERIRPVLGGRYLEYRMTAEDPKVLAKPYTYTRYYEKVNEEIVEYTCVDEK
jgi:hypothetical protein